MEALKKRMFAAKNQKNILDDDGDFKIYTPIYSSEKFNEGSFDSFELKAIKLLMLFSVSVQCLKIYFADVKLFNKFCLMAYTLLSEAWLTVLSLHWFLLPLIAGIFIVDLTWRIVYLNSAIPGVNPPSPFKSRNPFQALVSGNPFREHWEPCYIVPFVNGVVFFLVLLLINLGYPNLFSFF